MAAISLAGGVIQALVGSVTQDGMVADEALAIGDCVFQVTNSGTGTVGSYRRIINTSQEAATVAGVATSACKDGGTFTAITGGDWEITGATPFTIGAAYAASDTAGKLWLTTENGAADYGGIFCMATSTSTATVHKNTAKLLS